MNSQNLVNFELLNRIKLTKNRNLTFIVQVLAGIWNNIDSVSSRKRPKRKLYSEAQIETLYQSVSFLIDYV